MSGGWEKFTVLIEMKGGFVAEVRVEVGAGRMKKQFVRPMRPT